MNVPSKHEVDSQKNYIDRLDWDWIIWFDGGRYDYFLKLVHEYLTGETAPVWNGDVGYTGDWTVNMLSREFPGKGLFSPVHLSELGAVNYDPSRWFDVAPRYDDYEDVSVNERLAALGYKERAEDNDWTSSERVVNMMVRDHLDEIDGGIIRYTKPHPPFEGLNKITGGSGKVGRTKDALDEGDITMEEFIEGYIKTYRKAFKGAVDIIPDLYGKIVITADHGECLYDTCVQVYHARGHEPHDHLTVVPWMDVKEVIQ